MEAAIRDLRFDLSEVKSELEGTERQAREIVRLGTTTVSGSLTNQMSLSVDSQFVGLNATSVTIEVAIRPTGEMWKTHFGDESIVEIADKLKCLQFVGDFHNALVAEMCLPHFAGRPDGYLDCHRGCI